MTNDRWHPIDAAAKDGKPQLVRSGDDVAAAYWTGDMWAYDIPDAVHQVDFEPTEYRRR